MFQRNILPPSSELKSKPNMKLVLLVSCLAFSLTLTLFLTRLYHVIFQKTALSRERERERVCVCVCVCVCGFCIDDDIHIYISVLMMMISIHLDQGSIIIT
jgi:hypothetical protein